MFNKVLMNKIYAWVLAAAMVITAFAVLPITVSATDAVMPVDEDFTEFTNAASVGAESSGTLSAVADPVDGENGPRGKVLKLTGANAHFQYRFNPVLSNNVVVISYDFMVTDTNTIAWGELYGSGNVQKTTLGNHGGNLKVNGYDKETNDGTMGNGTVVKESSAKAWYRFTTVLDYTVSGKVTATNYIDGTRAGDAVEITKNSLKDGVRISRVRNHATYGGDLYIDNYRVYTVVPGKMGVKIANNISTAASKLELVFEDDLSASDMTALNGATIGSTSADSVLTVGTITKTATNKVEIPFTGTIKSGVEYCLNIPSGVKGMLGRGLKDTELYFALPAAQKVLESKITGGDFDSYTEGVPTSATITDETKISKKDWQAPHNTSLDITGSNANYKIEYTPAWHINSGKVEFSVDVRSTDDSKGCQALVLLAQGNTAYRIMLANNQNKIGLANGQNATTVEADESIDFSANSWYNMRFIFDFSNDELSYTVSKEDGTVSKSNTIDITDWRAGITEINGVGLYSLLTNNNTDYDTNAYFDNLEVNVLTDVPSVKSVKIMNIDGTEGVLGDAEAGATQLKVEFNSAMDKNSLDNITIDGAKIADISYTDSTTPAVITLTGGLAPNGEYTLTIPTVVTDTVGTGLAHPTIRKIRTGQGEFSIGDLKFMNGDTPVENWADIPNTGMSLVSDIINTEGEAGGLCIVYAAYKNKTLVDVEIVPVAYTSMPKGKASVDNISVDKNAVDTVKGFIFENMDYIKPLKPFIVHSSVLAD